MQSKCAGESGEVQLSAGAKTGTRIHEVSLEQFDWLFAGGWARETACAASVFLCAIHHTSPVDRQLDWRQKAVTEFRIIAAREMYTESAVKDTERRNHFTEVEQEDCNICGELSIPTTLALASDAPEGLVDKSRNVPLSKHTTQALLQRVVRF